MDKKLLLKLNKDKIKIDKNLILLEFLSILKQHLYSNIKIISIVKFSIKISLILQIKINFYLLPNFSHSFMTKNSNIFLF